MLFHAGLKIPFRCVPVRKTAQITQVRSESETLIVGNLRSPLCQRRLLQSHVPSSQKGRRYETGYRSKLTESIHRNTTFPDGTSFLDKNPPTTGVLHDKIGPKGCISFGCNSSTISKIPSVLLENQNLSVQSTPLRPKHSSNDLHSVNETSSELLTETRCPSGNLPRRYVDYWSISGRDKSVHGNGNRVIGVLGFIINKEKSIMTPTQVIQFLGFIINSNTMMILLPQEKVNKLQTLCRQILKIEKPALRSIAQLFSSTAQQSGRLLFTFVFFKLCLFATCTLQITITRRKFNFQANRKWKSNGGFRILCQSMAPQLRCLPRM